MTVPDSVGVEREAREVIAAGLHEFFTEGHADEIADAVLAALAEAGIEVGRWEQVGWRCTWRDLVDQEPYDQSWLQPERAGDSDVVSVPVYRRVDGGEAT